MKRLWIVAVAAAHLGVLNADTERPKNMEGNRFLFIMETSSSSSRLDHGGRQVLVDLIYTGLYGQMRNGDTFGLWAFNDQVFAGVYPMQVWDSEKTMDLASDAGQFLKSRFYRKKGKFEPVVHEVFRLIRNIKDVNIFIISDRETRPPTDAFGPAFDREYAETIDKLPNLKTPLITTVVGRNGSISNWFVTVGGQPIRLPPFAIPAHALPKPVTLAKTEPVRPKRAPIIMKGSSEPGTSATAENNTGSSQKLGKVISSSGEISYVSSSQTNVPPAAKGDRDLARPTFGSPVAAAPTVANASNPAKQSEGQKASEAVTQTAVKSVPQKEGAVKTAALPSRSPEQEIIAKASTTPPVPVPTRAEAPKAVQPSFLGPEPLKVAARERTSSAETNSAAAQAQHPPTVAATIEPTLTDRLFSPVAMIVIGGLLLTLAATLGLLFLQRARRPPQPSFITQSLERQ